MKAFKIIIICLILAVSSKAQNINSTSKDSINNKQLTEDQLKEFNSKIEDIITDFSNYLSKIADRINYPDEELRKSFIDYALRDFIYNGDSVFIEISSLYKPTKILLLKVYLERLANLKFTSVRLTNSQIIIVSDFRWDGGFDADNNYTYIATATYYQKFVGKKGDNIIYKDITKRQVEIHLIKDIPTDSWVVKLGDISVESTENTN